MHHLLLALYAIITAVTAKQCANITIPVNVSARNGVFSIAIPHSNLDVTQFSLNLTSASGNFTNTSLAGYTTVIGEALISAKLCAPDTLPKQSVVQLLTHGIGFDKT